MICYAPAYVLFFNLSLSSTRLLYTLFLPFLTAIVSYSDFISANCSWFNKVLTLGNVNKVTSN
jgi:hypothetical protein|nr:MAG TPA: hypothetical protein [Bacteriophage sp.]